MDSPADQTLRLGLPFIMAAQSLKHITHNEALQRLDALVHLAVSDRDRTVPPSAPEEGDRHIVGPGATGGWTGQSGRLAVRQGGGWVFYVPRAGWRAHVLAEARDIVHDGEDWTEAGGAGVNPVPLVGINATADEMNRLSVKSPASLFDHDGTDHRLKLNKAHAADTASILFQTGYSGRAEFGLSGDNDWRVKVSADGAAWVDALRVAAGSGRVTLPAALSLTDPDQAVAARHIRERLTANRTYYVRADGSNANDGLSNTAGGAFATLQKAMDVIAGLDCDVHSLTVSVGAGTYTAGLVLKSYLGSGSVSFVGDETTPANVTIEVAGLPVSTSAVGGSFSVAGFRLRSTGSQDVRCLTRTSLTLRSNEYAGTSNYRVFCGQFGRISFAGSNNAISSLGGGFLLIQAYGYVEMFSTTFTITANLTMTGAFAFCQAGFLQVALNTFTLGGFTVTGNRATVTQNGVISGTGGTSYFPGSVAASALTGGQYS
ncbi:Protein of unknown function [Devosia enhydra]|uniref:DUF2793 domain-containing protein n=1 Tax=Devosia enhydra TaxID=665118 RepID=A0A1K2I274_9HYPH|nr:DUF2793 domain-containing protein [Devosia enhydra]SFZ86485.1 Protein of unknown function [Devosia enhydra]